nr:histamine H2 receptor-like isoform X2 [Pocillopora verrucosa]
MDMEETIAPNNSILPRTEYDDNFLVDFTVVETAFAAAALLVIMIACLTGNLVICYVVFRSRRMWTEMNMFLVNLAISDIAMTFLSMLSPLETALIRKWAFGTGPVCQLNAFCTSVLICNTIFTHTAISIDRFFAVVKPMEKVMTKRKAFFSIAGVWMLSVAITIGPMVGWGRNVYNASTLQCGFKFPENEFEKFYILCLAVIAFLLPLIIMSYAYIRIYIVVRNHTRRLSTSTIVAASVSSREKIPRGLGIAAYWCGFMNSAINPYLIGLRSEKFYDAFVAVFCCRFHSCKCNSNERKNESTNPNDQMLCTDGKRESPLEQTSQMAHVGDDYANSFLNMAAVSDINATQETSAKITNDEKTRHQRRQGRDETPGVIYPCYIHMVDGKLWNEAIV